MMKRLFLILCAMILIAVMTAGCAKRAADDVSEAASEVVSDIKEDADKYGKVDDNTDAATDPTMSNVDQMIENGEIDDENDDDYDGDNIDDDKKDKDESGDSSDGDQADGGEHNAETMNEDDSSFI